MKNSFTWLLFVLILCNHGYAGTLAVPSSTLQQTDHWCWAGVSQQVLRYYGVNRTQCEIANWALSAKSNTTKQCCVSTVPAECDVGNTMYAEYGENGSIQAILQHFAQINSVGIKEGYSPFRAGVLSPSDIITEMNAGRPIVMMWEFGGIKARHYVAAKGFIGSDSNGIMRVYDPDKNAKVYEIATTYSGALSTTDTQNPKNSWTWMDTLKLLDRKMPSVNINVNGMEGPVVNVTSTTNLSINVSVNPNGYNNNNQLVELWAGFDINGSSTVNYYVSNGATTQVTTTPIPWKKMQLTGLNNQSIYAGTLPVGNYNMYFALDLNPNGILDSKGTNVPYAYDALYWDMVAINVR